MQRPASRQSWQTRSEQFYHLLISLYMHLMEGEDRLFASEGIERNMFWALWHIGRQPQGTSMTALSRAIWSDKSTITHLVDRMEEAGLVQRNQHQRDRRVKTLVLTPKGRTLRERLIARHEEALAQLLPPERVSRQSAAYEQLSSLEEHMRSILAEKSALQALPTAAPEEGASPKPTRP